MFSILGFLLILLLPIPVLIRGISKGASPFRTILVATLSAVSGVAIICLVAHLTGNSFIEELRTGAREISRQLAANEEFSKSVGVGDMDMDERVDKLASAYDTILQAVPTAVLVLSVIISWIEGIIVGKSLRRNGRPLNPVPPLRELTLPKSAVWGWLLLWVLSWICKSINSAIGPVLSINISAIFQFVFAVQGMALILMFFYKKRVPKVVPVLIIIVAWAISFGEMAMFILGLFDCMFELRKRIRDKNDGAAS